MTRQTKTPRQRAEEALGVAERKVLRLTEQLEKLVAEGKTVEQELLAAQRRRDYAATNPDLPNNNNTTQEKTA